MNYQKQIFYKCYCKSLSLQLFFSYSLISPDNLASFFLINLLWKLCSNYSDYAPFDEFFFFFVLYYCVSFWLPPRWWPQAISNARHLSMQDFRCHTLWSVWGSWCEDVAAWYMEDDCFRSLTTGNAMTSGNQPIHEPRTAKILLF